MLARSLEVKDLATRIHFPRFALTAKSHELETLGEVLSPEWKDEFQECRHNCVIRHDLEEHFPSDVEWIS